MELSLDVLLCETVVLDSRAAALSWQGAFGVVFRHWAVPGALGNNLFLSRRAAFVLTGRS